MDSELRKAIEELLHRRTTANTTSRTVAREWILRDGVHRADGWLNRDPDALDSSTSNLETTKAE